MKLVWHLARKDLRRAALPAGVWLALIVGTTFWFRGGLPAMEGNVSAGLGEWMSLLSIWVQLLLGVQLIFGYVLAGALLLEDPAVGTDNFWLTRPFSRGRMLAAKLVAAALLFALAPVVVLAPIWLASGFSGRDLLAGAGEFFLWHGFVVLIALGIASLSRNLAQFLLCTVGVFVAFYLCWWGAANLGFGQDVAPGVRRSRYLLGLAGVAVAMTVVLAQQYLTRRTLEACATLGAGWLAVVVIATVWPFDLVSAGRAQGEEAFSSETSGIVIPSTFTKSTLRSNELPNAFVTTPWSAEEFVAPANALFPDGNVGLAPASNWGEQAGLRLLGVNHDASPITWQLTARASSSASMNEPQFAGTLEFWRIRAQVMGEMPLRVDAVLAGSGNRTRVVGIEREQGRLDAVFIEEHERHFSFASNVVRGGGQREFGPGSAHVDRYFLVDRTAQRAQPLSAGEVGVIMMNGLRIRCRRLFVAGAQPWSAAVIVKIRFERVSGFQRPLTLHGIVSRRGESQP